jgi:predicted TIM-barrel fold metal-dependent hydrolase
MQLSDYHPRSALVVPATAVTAPRFPVIDMHNHLFGDWDTRPAADLIAMLDRCGVRGFLDLDGGWGEEILYRHLDKLKAADPARFRVFGGIDWSQWPTYGTGFVEWAAERMREQARRGADGFKVWKMLGTSVRDQTGALVSVDDARLDLLWRTAGELNLPVTFHVADPVAFFDPLDASNERWEELQANPDWQFPSPPFPAFLSIVNGMANVVARHPTTTFIGAHGGCYSENLAWVSDLFERCPNFYIDISARLNEFGRQPYASRRFFLKYSERILFGLDFYASPAPYQLYYRFLETDDEYFPYDPAEIPPQGRWRIYGIYLPDEVLARVYYQNAEQLIFKR